MEINVLGPLEAWVNGHSIAPTATKPRQVLSLLAVHAGQLVTVPTIIEELWGPKTPRSAVQTVQTYILGIRRRLREVLPPGKSTAKRILATRPCGYILDIPADDVDANRFSAQASAGERAFGTGDYDTAAKLLGAALDGWRGPALMDVHAGDRLAIEVTRLEQSRLLVLETRIVADLRLGRHHQLLGELAELTAQYPMHETLCAHYMTALSASGLKWRALEVFRALRRTLVSELGVEPSLEVQRLQRGILGAGRPAAVRLPASG